MAKDAAGSESKIRPILGHLAWWEVALRDTATPETPYRKALLVLNAATLLEWHLTFAGRDSRDRLAAPKAAKKAAILADAFAEAARKCVRKTEFLTAENAETPLGSLADSTNAFVKKLAKLYEYEATAKREPEFELAIKPANLIASSLPESAPRRAPRRPKASQESAGTRTGLGTPERQGCIHALLPAMAAQRLFDEGKLSAEAYTSVRRDCAELLEDVLNATKTSDRGPEEKRLRTLGKPVVEALRRPVATRSGSRGA